MMKGSHHPWHEFDMLILHYADCAESFLVEGYKERKEERPYFKKQ